MKMLKGQLFSSYFLHEGIKFTDDYKNLNEKELKNLYLKIKDIYNKFPKRSNPDEIDTEEGLLCPVLNLLGYTYSRQKSISREGRYDVPDFILFSNKKDKERFDSVPLHDKPWNIGIAILESKRWNRKLDRGDKTDPIDQNIPSNQILRYLSNVEVASNGKILWGILTNGRLWRLYYHKFPTRSEGYMEIDFDNIFDDSTLYLFGTDISSYELFKIFYLIFRKDAFIHTDFRSDKTFLEVALEDGKK